MSNPNSVSPVFVDVEPPLQEELHSLKLLPLEDTLGRRAVLLTNLELGSTISREYADANAAIRKKEADHTSIVTHKSRFYTAEEKDALEEWEIAKFSVAWDSLYLPAPELVDDELQKVREEIERIDSETFGADFDGMFNNSAPPLITQWVTDWLNKEPTENPDGTWLRWISHMPESPEEITQLLNFLQWHNHRLEMLQQSPEFIDVIEEQIEAYIDAVGHAEDDGWLMPGAYARAYATLEEGSSHFVADEFTAALIGGAAAYAHREERTTAFNAKGKASGETDRLVANIRKNAYHECNHLEGELPERWLDEAVTEHIAQALKGRSVEDVYVMGTQEVIGHELYAAERNLLQAVILKAQRYQRQQGHQRVVEVADFTRTYSAKHTRYYDKMLESLFLDLDSTFGFDVMGAIANFITVEEAKLQSHGVVNIRQRQRCAAEAATYMVYQEPDVLRQYLPIEPDSVKIAV